MHAVSSTLLQMTASATLAVGLVHCSSSDDTGSAPAASAAAGALGTWASAGTVGNAGGSAASAAGGTSAAGNDTAGTTAISNAGTAGNGTAGSGDKIARGGTGGTNAGAGGASGGSGAAPYKPCPATGQCVIMPLGDSITEGYNSSTGGGYRLRLLHDIWASDRDATFVGNSSSGPSALDAKPFPKNNEGHSGYTIDPAPSVGRTGISPLVAASLKKHSPHVITLMIGTNDIGTNNDIANAPTRLGNLIDTITATSPKALLVVAQITPLGDKTGNTRAQSYNAAIPNLVKTRVAAGKHIIVVDMYTPFAAHPDYMAGLHPKDVGYDFMGDLWYMALAPHL